jgi:hypothetical protein
MALATAADNKNLGMMVARFFETKLPATTAERKAAVMVYSMGLREGQLSRVKRDGVARLTCL